MIILQKDTEARLTELQPRLLIRAFGLSLAIPIAFFVLFAFVMYLFPAYIFCWGDEAKRYAARVRIRNYVLGGVLLTLVLGVIASVIANRPTFGR